MRPAGKSKYGAVGIRSSDAILGNGWDGGGCLVGGGPDTTGPIGGGTFGRNPGIYNL